MAVADESAARLAELPGWAQEFVASLMAEVAALKAELAAAMKNSRNSSKPPSTEHPHAKPAPKPKKSDRKQGAQPGHDKHQRELIPSEQCSIVHDHKPKTCGDCGQSLRGAVADLEPLRKQVWEVPEIKPQVTEHRLHRLTCVCCGGATRAELPPDVPSLEAGPRLVALTAILMAEFRCSKRKVAAFLQDVLSIPCSPGWVIKLQNRATEAMRPAYNELAKKLPTEKRLNIDESPTKQKSLKAWLWVFVASKYTLFSLRPTRKATALFELLGPEFAGVVSSDRAKMYHHFGLLQWCWAHLIRDFQSWKDGQDGAAKRLARDLEEPVTRLFELWSRVRDGTLSRADFKIQVQPIRKTIDSLLLRGVYRIAGPAQATCKELTDHRDRLWAFVDHEGVEPTNNAAERALRQAVIWRKLSFGTQSEKGSRFVETMLTILESCRQQGRSAYKFAMESVSANYGTTPAPTLTGA